MQDYNTPDHATQPEDFNSFGCALCGLILPLAVVAAFTGRLRFCDECAEALEELVRPGDEP